MIFFIPIFAIVLILTTLYFDYKDDSEKSKIFVKRGDDLRIPITYQQLNNNFIKNEITLMVPAVFTLKEYHYEDTTENKITNSTFFITYEDLTQTETIQTDDLVGVSFDAKIGTTVQYVLEQDIDLELNESLINVFIFNTDNLKPTSYPIEIMVNNETYHFEVIVNDTD